MSDNKVTFWLYWNGEPIMPIRAYPFVHNDWIRVKAIEILHAFPKRFTMDCCEGDAENILSMAEVRRPAGT